MKRRVCVVTGSRAEYGLLYWLMKDLQAGPGFELQVVVTGMHLAEEFGSTWRTVVEDGFAIDAKVDMLLASDSPAGMAKSTGLGVIGFADAFERLRPDLVVVLGDRFEILAAAQAALLLNVPIAHLHGGEVTEGAVDESIRHAVTKMAHYHFVAAEPYRRRVIQMGEHPERVFNVGAPGLDHLARLNLLDRAALEAELGVRLPSPLFLVTYHPATRSGRPAGESLDELLAALDDFPEAHLLITKSNADAGGRTINRRLEEFAAEQPGRVTLVASLGQLRFLSALALADVFVGNSSSGLIEAPSAGTVTVNVGDRQAGRLRAPTVLDCAESHSAIRDAVARALSPEMQDLAAKRENPYGGAGQVARRIVAVLKQTQFDKILRKGFFDLPPVAEPSRPERSSPPRRPLAAGSAW